jgi:hypothetical protein
LFPSLTEVVGPTPHNVISMSPEEGLEFRNRFLKGFIYCRKEVT